MQNSPRWLSIEEIIETNREQVTLTGEDHIILDLGGLDSAAHNPRMAFDYGGEDDVIVLAVSLFLAINRNHPFVQGNKRTAWLSALQFLASNGYVTSLPDIDEFAEFLTRVATGEIERELLEYFLWRCSSPVT